MKINKNTIIQIFWIILVGLALYFFYNGQDAKQEVQKIETIQEQKTDNIEKLCMERAIEKANEPDLEVIAESGNPYLTKKDIPGMRENIKQVQFKECMDIWGD